MRNLLLLALLSLPGGNAQCPSFMAALVPVNTICCANNACGDSSASATGMPSACSFECSAAWNQFSSGPCRAALDRSSQAGTMGSQMDNLCANVEPVETDDGPCPSSPPGMPGTVCAATYESICIVSCQAGGGGHRRTQTGSAGYFVCGSGGQWNPAVPCGAEVAPHIDTTDDSKWVLANGMVMPTMSFGLQVYNDQQATEYMALALDAGIRNFFASVLANNQVGAGNGIDAMTDLKREDIFVCGSVTQCQTSFSEQQCYEYTRDLAARNLADLDVTYVDQVMLDYPPSPQCSDSGCTLIKAQWKAFEEMHSRGEALSLAVSNYCPCHLDCLLDAINDPTDTIRITKPVVNQLKYHIGMGADPHTMIADNLARGIVVQAYSSLGSGSSQILNNPTVAAIAAAHGKSAAQVSFLCSNLTRYSPSRIWISSVLDGYLLCSRTEVHACMHAVCVLYYRLLTALSSRME